MLQIIFQTSLTSSTSFPNASNIPPPLMSSTQHPKIISTITRRLCTENTSHFLPVTRESSLMSLAPLLAHTQLAALIHKGPKWQQSSKLELIMANCWHLPGSCPQTVPAASFRRAGCQNQNGPSFACFLREEEEAAANPYYCRVNAKSNARCGPMHPFAAQCADVHRALHPTSTSASDIYRVSPKPWYVQPEE